MKLPSWKLWFTHLLTTDRGVNVSSRGLLFISVFTFCVLGALALPQLGIYGYLADYCLNPADQWWGRPFAQMGIRFSFTLALATMAGIFLQRKKLRFGEKLIEKQEWLMVLFLLVVWGLYFFAPQTVGRYGSTDHPAIKLAKIFIFTLMMTHVITDLNKLKGLFAVLSSAAFLLGIKAWSVPYSAFSRGRLEGIGGADFSEANFFAAFMAAMLPLIGIMFLRSRWPGKLYYAACGAFTANAVVLCRSRGAFLGLVMGAVAAFIFAPKKYRKHIVILCMAGMVGVIYLSDDFFIQRIMSISTDQSEMDESSSSRIRLWKAGLRMVASHPLGIGPGNWYQTIGRYIPEYEGKDSHSTYVKCFAELGVIGLAVFLLFLLQSSLNLRHIYLQVHSLPPPEEEEFTQLYFAILVALVIFMTCALTITMIYTEILWVLLMLPVCLKRSLDNYLQDQEETDGF
nr:O-antigen ligase family protein [Desulfuromonas acetoxidans]